MYCCGRYKIVRVALKPREWARRRGSFAIRYINLRKCDRCPKICLNALGRERNDQSVEFSLGGFGAYYPCLLPFKS